MGISRNGHSTKENGWRLGVSRTKSSRGSSDGSDQKKNGGQWTRSEFLTNECELVGLGSKIGKQNDEHCGMSDGAKLNKTNLEV